jgi:hypothetical protein
MGKLEGLKGKACQLSQQIPEALSCQPVNRQDMGDVICFQKIDVSGGRAVAQEQPRFDFVDTERVVFVVLKLCSYFRLGHR